MFDHVEYVNLCVEMTLALMVDFLLLGHLAFSFATAAVEPATQAVDIFHKPNLRGMAVRVTKDFTVLNGSFNLQLVFVEGSVIVV